MKITEPGEHIAIDQQDSSSHRTKPGRDERHIGGLPSTASQLVCSLVGDGVRPAAVTAGLKSPRPNRTS